MEGEGEVRGIGGVIVPACVCATSYARACRPARAKLCVCTCLSESCVHACSSMVNLPCATLTCAGILQLRALAVKRMNPKIEVYLQLLKGTSLPLAIDMTAVAMNTLKFGLLAKSAVCPGIIPLIGNLLRSIDSKGVKRIGKKKDLKIEPEYLKGMESEIYRCTIPESLRGRKFGDMVEQVYNYKNKGLLLFAVSADRMPGNASMFGSSKDLSGLASQTPGTRT